MFNVIILGLGLHPLTAGRDMQVSGYCLAVEMTDRGKERYTEPSKELCLMRRSKAWCLQRQSQQCQEMGLGQRVLP